MGLGSSLGKIGKRVAVKAAMKGAGSLAKSMYNNMDPNGIKGDATAKINDVKSKVAGSIADKLNVPSELSSVMSGKTLDINKLADIDLSGISMNIPEATADIDQMLSAVDIPEINIDSIKDLL